MAEHLDSEMASQLRRAALSVNLNIAEGTGRFDRDQRKYLITARRSALECAAVLDAMTALGLSAAERGSRCTDRSHRLDAHENDWIVAYACAYADAYVGSTQPNSVLIDNDELAGVVAAEARVEIVLRAAHRADASDDARGLGRVATTARTGRVVDGKWNELVAIVRTAAQARLVRAATRHAYEARALARRTAERSRRQHLLGRHETASVARAVRHAVILGAAGRTDHRRRGRDRETTTTAATNERGTRTGTRRRTLFRRRCDARRLGRRRRKWTRPAPNDQRHGDESRDDEYEQSNDRNQQRFCRCQRHGRRRRKSGHHTRRRSIEASNGGATGQRAFPVAGRDALDEPAMDEVLPRPPCRTW